MITELKSSMSRFLYTVDAKPRIQVGDPIIPVGDQYTVLQGKGDFRQTQETAYTLMLLAEGIALPKEMRP